MSNGELATGADIDALAALSVSDLNTNVNHEPRILDLRVAERLGYSRPRDIRAIIEKHHPELETYGTLVCANMPQTSRGGRPGHTYWLNEAQTLLICMFSKTDRAALIRKEVIEVFMEWRRSGAPRPPNPAADERNQRKALALMDRLRAETDPAIRQFVHDMLAATARDMGLTAPPLAALGRAASPPPDILIPFWRAIYELKAAGVRLNHAHDGALIALRLPEVREEFRKSQIMVPVAGMLRDALKQSRAPRFVAVKAVASVLERKTVKCWVFEGWNAPKAGG